MEKTEEKNRAAAPGTDGNDAQQQAGGAHDEHQIPKDLPRPSALTVIGAVAAFVIVLVALFVVGLIPHRLREHQAVTDANEQTAAAGTPVVQLTRAEPATEGRNLILPCDVRANQDTLIFPR